MIISKELFYKMVPNTLKCRDFIHYTWAPENCLKAVISFWPAVFPNAARFYLPIYLIKIIIHGRKTRKQQYLKYMFYSYLRSVVFASTFGTLIIVNYCSTCALLGRMTYWTTGLTAGLTSGMAIFMESPEFKSVNIFYTTTLFIEALFNNLKYFDIFYFNITQQTITFMLINSYLMYLMRNYQHLKLCTLWFYKSPLNEKGEKCYHKKEINCFQYCWEGFRKYFLLGFGISFVRSLFGKTSKLSIRYVVRVLLRKKNITYGLLMGNYVAIFRAASCFLSKFRGKKSDPAIAGFMAGSTFALEPNLQMLVVAVTTILEITWYRIKNNLNISEKLPLAGLFFMLCNGFLYHNRIFASDTCPEPYKHVLNICSGNRLNEIYSNFLARHLQM